MFKYLYKGLYKIAYEQCYSETKLDGCMSIVAPWLVIGVLGLGAYGFYKLCTDDEFNKKIKKNQKQNKFQNSPHQKMLSRIKILKQNKSNC